MRVLKCTQTQPSATTETLFVCRSFTLFVLQLLEVMAKQQSDAQAAAAAATIAQNEALKNFQETIASVVVPLSQRLPTAVPLPEKDPK